MSQVSDGHAARATPRSSSTHEARPVRERGLTRKRKKAIERICPECRQQVGLEATREAHPNLREPSATVLDPDFLVHRFQRLYQCRLCPTVLSRGRNTGWSAAFSMIASPTD